MFYKELEIKILGVIYNVDSRCRTVDHLSFKHAWGDPESQSQVRGAGGGGGQHLIIKIESKAYNLHESLNYRKTNK